MAPLPRPSVSSYNRGRPTSSGSVPSTRVVVDRSLISQLSRLACPDSLGPRLPLGSARYVYVRGRRGGRGGERAGSIVRLCKGKESVCMEAEEVGHGEGGGEEGGRRGGGRERAGSIVRLC